MTLAFSQQQSTESAAPQRVAGQPAARYLFLDLDPLLASVQTHVQAQSTVFHGELARMSVAGVLVHPERLTALLDGHQPQQQHAVVVCRLGSYFNPSVENARALQAVGWDLKKKGASEHRTLENLLERNLEHVGICGAWGPPKTVALATGALTPPTQSCLQAYLASGWRVQIFCLQRCWKQALDEMNGAFPSRFEVVYVDKFLKHLLMDRAAVASPAAPRGSSLLSQMATDGIVWNEMSARRSVVHPVPHARALALAAAPPAYAAPSSYHRSSLTAHGSSVSGQDVAKVMAREQNAVQRRQSRLMSLPSVYTSGHRQRYVFMNLDNIAGALFTSQMLYRCIEGASSPRAIRLDFEALTDRLCGSDNSALVQRQLATYCKTSPCLARALLEFGWTLKPVAATGNDAKALHYELMSQLIRGAATTNEKTLVLVMGDGGLGDSANSKTVYRETICKFLEQRWCVEVHAWLHALNDGFLELQGQYPGRVVVKPLDDAVRDLVYLKDREEAVSAPVEAAPAAIGRCPALRMERAPPPAHVPSPRPATPSIAHAPPAPRAAAISPPSPVTPSVASFFAFAAAPPPLPPVDPLLSALQQMRQLQEALEALQTEASMRQSLQQKNEQLVRSMREQERAFEEERARQAALAAQQASDARLARRLGLEEREERLTCPITQELYEAPATTVCCGKTFSGKALAHLRELDARCPWCREYRFLTHPNRDVADLVAQYLSEKAAFDAEEGGGGGAKVACE